MRFCVILLFICLTKLGNAQYLSWFVTAHSGNSSFNTANVNNAVLAGFKTEGGQQFSFGPVIKSYLADQKLGNIPGFRMYSQTALYQGINVYLQCDIANGDRFHAFSMGAPLRIESGAGLNFTIRERVGFGVGYNFGEFNPLNNARQTVPVFKFLYVLPFDKDYF